MEETWQFTLSAYIHKVSKTKKKVLMVNAHFFVNIWGRLVEEGIVEFI